jgi:type 1 glutamine amidotransferase
MAGGAIGGGVAAGSAGGTAGGGSAAGGIAGGGSTGGVPQTGGSSGEAAGGSAGSGGASGATAPDLPKNILLYTFSTLEIPSVPTQVQLLTSTLQELGFAAETSADPAIFNDDDLARFGAVGMVNTCFEPFGAGQPGSEESAALQRFVAGGGGLFGTHCAAVTFQSATPPAAYNGLIGGRGGDGFFEGQSACRKVADHSTTAALPATFDYVGNLDNADFVAEDSTVLVKCTWSGDDPRDVAVSWLRSEGLGRVFYTNFAKTDQDLSDTMLWPGHILPGLKWVLWL